MPANERTGTAELARRLGQPAAAFTASGAAALELAFELLELDERNEVIVPDIGCHAIASAVIRRGGVPVFVGVGTGLTLTPAEVLAALSPRTRAVVAAHHYGLPCDARSIAAALPPEVVVVEDIAPTWGTYAGGVPCGSAGTLTVTSFGPSKPVSLGGGGALLGPETLLHGAVSHGDVRDRALTRPPSAARLPPQLLEDLSAAIATADHNLKLRRAAVTAFLHSDLSEHFRLPLLPPRSTAAWTRVPLYPEASCSDTHLRRLSAALGHVQEMHAVPPSGLPMFARSAKRVVCGAGRPIEPLLVQIGQPPWPR